MELTLIQDRKGYSYWCDAEDTLYIQRLQAGQYQRANWLFAQRLIDDYTQALDIGANNACNTIHYAERFQQVRAWEPTLTTQELWSKTVQANHCDNVMLETAALSNATTLTHMILHDKNHGHNHIDHAPWNPRSRPESRTRPTQPIQTRTLDSYGDITAGFIKIDVEGAELMVMQGADHTIQRERPTIQWEMVADQCTRFNYTPQDIIEWLRSRDYVIVSKTLGVIDGHIQVARKPGFSRLVIRGEEVRGDMDFFAQPLERCDTRPWISMYL